MDISPDAIKAWTRQNGFRPTKSLGQHFLLDQKVFDQILSCANLSSRDRIIEIGPGIGNLTTRLCNVAKEVVGIEKDKRFQAVLRKLQSQHQNLQIVWEDVLSINIPMVTSNKPYKVVSNLPYQITSYVFRNFLSSSSQPTEMTVLIQKEVAERICASPGKMSLLSLSVQLYGKPRIQAIVPPSAFWPLPNVDSAILTIKDIGRNHFPLKNEKGFFQLIKIGFSSKRKQLKNNLANSYPHSRKEINGMLVQIGCSSTCRAQELSISHWIRLLSLLTS